MNAQREAFKGKVAEHMKAGAGDGHAAGGGGMKTIIEHHEDGKAPHGAPEGTMHTVTHYDGEVSHHPNMAHAGMHMAAKHEVGEHGHIMPHPGGGATTHHVGMDGKTQGPHEHESEQDGYSHLQQNIGDGAGGGMMGEPEMAAAAGGEGDSSFE